MRLFLLIIISSLFVFSNCENVQKPTSVVLVTMTPVQSKNCIDTICAEINLSYPILSGGSNPTAVQAINDSILSIVYLSIDGDPTVPLPNAYHTACLDLLNMLEEELANDPNYPFSYVIELNTTLLFQNNKVVSFEMSNYSFTGGAHGNYGSALNTFLLDSGKSVQLSDIVKDTIELRSMLEKMFVETKNAEIGEQLTLEELVFPECIPLPLPMQWCIVKDGLRVTYNPYEVAPYVVGQTDLVVTWEQLKGLVDRDDWLE
ncbi:MAG: DUF3298 and DUF4163 domain-containing protein [Saprospiraceae bacterium]|nr:DUF3298 and DUF4163 domain-containing protein [Saprospiraceae bacterium]MCB9343743.1 DUF3298 and DUF4163 domain-containing protein [Lewinellaceae bacterium]